MDNKKISAHGGARANSGAKKQDLVHLHILIPRELSEQIDALTVSVRKIILVIRKFINCF